MSVGEVANGMDVYLVALQCPCVGYSNESGGIDEQGAGRGWSVGVRVYESGSPASEGAILSLLADEENGKLREVVWDRDI
jgi:hypothetical protein